MEILIAVPYHEQKRYCLNELYDWIKDADLKDCEVVIRFHKGTYGEKDAVKKQREFFRRLAIYRDADYLFFMGADTIPPLDVIPKLLARNEAVVGGVYYGRTESTNGNSQQAVAWKHKELDLTKRENLEKQTGLMEVDGMGMDCLLLSKQAYQAVSFIEWVQNDDDYPFFDKLKEKGFKIFLDTEIICKHYYSKDKYN